MTAVVTPPVSGVVTDLREIDGRTVGWFRLAGGPHRGAIGPSEGTAVERMVRLATELGVPIVGELASSGADVGHGIASLHAWGRVARAIADASGVVPVVLAVTGPCVSGPALLLGLADHVVMTAAAFAYVSGPGAVARFTGVPITREELGGAPVHERRSGVASLVVADDDEVPLAVGDLLAFLPSNWLDPPPVAASDDPLARRCERAEAAVPKDPVTAYDVRAVVRDVVDRDSMLEVRAHTGQSVVTAYARVGGAAVGVVANQPTHLAGTLDIDASSKAARFVQCCDAFGLPLLTFVDTPGFQPGKDLEWRGMIRHGAELVHAYATATVPRICVVLRKAYGGAYIVMDSRGLGNDVSVAWPGAEIAVMGAPGAVQVLHGRRLATVADDGDRGRLQAELEAEYAARYCTPAAAVERGYVDAVIEPRETRQVVAAALARLQTKRAAPTERRKHANTPL